MIDTSDRDILCIHMYIFIFIQEAVCLQENDYRDRIRDSKAAGDRWKYYDDVY
jgi:hypothetical protein